MASSPYCHQLEANRSYFPSCDANFTFNCNMADMKVILKLLYTGKLTLSRDNVDRIANVCCMLQIDSAVEACRRYQGDNKRFQGDYKKYQSDTKESLVNSPQIINNGRGDNLDFCRQISVSNTNNIHRQNSEAAPNANNLKTVSDSGLHGLFDSEDTLDKDDVVNDMAQYEESMEMPSMCDTPIQTNFSYVKMDSEANVLRVQEELTSDTSTSQMTASNLTHDPAAKNDKTKNPDDIKANIEDEKNEKSGKKRKIGAINENNKTVKFKVKNIGVKPRKKIKKKSRNKSTLNNDSKGDDVKETENTINLENMSGEDSNDTDDDGGVKFVSAAEADHHGPFTDPTLQRYPCRTCQIVFINPMDLIEHRTSMHPSNNKKNKFTCDICFRKPNNWPSLVEHKFKKHNIPYDMNEFTLIKCERDVSISCQSCCIHSDGNNFGNEF